MTATDRDDARARGRGLLGYVPEGERVILDIKPDPASIVLLPLGMLAGLALGAAVYTWVVAEYSPEVLRALPPRYVWLIAGGVAAGRIGWQVLDWMAKRYVLTEARVIRVRGVFRQHVLDAPLRRVQHVRLYRSLRERLTGLGTLGFATAGTGVVEAYWVMIPGPREHLEIVRRTVAAASAAREAAP